MENADYKTITLPISGSSRSFAMVERVLSGYPREDIYVDRENGEMVIHLRQLDFSSFRKNVQELLEQSDSSDSELLMLVLDNIEKIRSYGLKGKKRLYVGYNKERKVKGRKEKERTRGMYYYTKGVQFSKHNNEVPREMVNRIIVGDSELVLKGLPENCIDMVFTSPPYNFGLDYGDEHQDGTDWNEYFDKLFRVFAECIRVLKYGGRIIVNVQPLFSDYIPLHHIVSDFFMKQRLIWKGEIIWDKHNWNCKYTAWGSWKSPSNPYLKYTWEFLEIFCKGDMKKPGSSENIDISAEEFKKLVIAKWDFAPARNMEEYGHPAMFPESLVAAALKLFSYRGDVILDPFNGVGTTSAVAKKLSRRYIGIDISEDYCRKAEKRVKATEENLALFHYHEKTHGTP